MTSRSNKIKVNERYLEFSAAWQLKQFVERYSQGQERFEFEFAEPVLSGGREVYIPADVLINESRLSKLDQYDEHNPYYRIKNTDSTLKFYVVFLRKQFANILKKSRYDFLMFLFEGISGSTIGGIITYALYDPHSSKNHAFTLWLLKVFEQDPELFEYLSRAGLYALGTAFSVHKRHSFLHRNAFQMGLVADLNAPHEELLDASIFSKKQSFQKEYCATAAQAALRLGLSEQAAEAIRLHLDEEELLKIDEEPPKPVVSLFDEDTIRMDEDPKKGSQKDEELRRELLSIMRVTRYFVESEKAEKDIDKRLRNIVGGLAYLSEKELLPSTVVKPILKRCYEHKDLIRKMKRIAQVEASCIQGDLRAAWAYPKPDATQVICLNHHLDCPNLLSGRPIHVVGLGEYNMMRFSRPGEYNKCRLAEELPK